MVLASKRLICDTLNVFILIAPVFRISPAFQRIDALASFESHESVKMKEAAIHPAFHMAKSSFQHSSTRILSIQIRDRGVPA
jgi:hypothetical protein